MKILLALGANLPSQWGNPAETLSQAIGKLSERISSDVDVSRFFETPAFPAGKGPDFVNAAVAFDTDFSANKVLEICHSIENEAHRTRDSRWAARTLDIDLIACGQQILPDTAIQTKWRTLPMGEQISEIPPELILPHPRLQDRAFVLVPLADVAPEWRHPVLNLTTVEMLDRLPSAEKQAVKPLESL